MEEDFLQATYKILQATINTLMDAVDKRPKIHYLDKLTTVGE